jgi:uncharacterized protein YcbK (DUF882 family)
MTIPMIFRLMKTAVLAIACAGLVVVGAPEASAAKKGASSAKKSPPKKAKKGKGRGAFAGYGVGDPGLRDVPLPRPTGRIVLKSPALGDEVDVNIYNFDGSLNQTALAKLDRVFRCRQTGEERAVDPHLYEVLSLVFDHFGQKKIEINSGFRYQRNDGSRHFHASAMDIQIPGVPYMQIWEYAASLDRGGMGIGKYPNNGFVHIDFRAPGEPSYRWTDTQRSRRRDPGKAPDKMWQKNRSSKPNT